MARRWFVQTSDDKIIGVTDNDDAEAIDGTTAVTDATIRAADPPGADGDIQVGGTWDGTTYTAPTGGGVLIPYDVNTTEGQLKKAALQLHDLYILLQTNLESDDGPGTYAPQKHQSWAHDFLAYSHRGTRGVFLSTALTSAQKLSWAAANGAGPSDVPEDNRAAFFTVVEDWTADTLAERLPTSRVLFAHPASANRWKLEESVGFTTNAITAGLLADETTDFSDYINGKWIEEITA